MSRLIFACVSLAFFCSVILIALGGNPPPLSEQIGSFTVPMEGSILPKHFQVKKLDPLYDGNGNPARIPTGIVLPMPVSSFGSTRLSNPHDVQGVRIFDYSLNGYEVWMPHERVAWMRERNVTEFTPGSRTFSDNPNAFVFAYAHGPHNGYGGANQPTIGPESIKTIEPGEIETDQKSGQGFRTVLISDPLVLRSLMLAPGEDPNATTTWTYQRTFEYNTVTPAGSPVVLPYIPIQFLGGTDDPATVAEESIEIYALWKEAE